MPPHMQQQMFSMFQQMSQGQNQSMMQNASAELFQKMQTVQNNMLNAQKPQVN